MGARSKEGYGQIKLPAGPRLVHRVAYSELRGPIPPGMKVCHRCDNPPCWEIDHLFLGTDADNKRDSVEKGRHKFPVLNGEEHGMAKLSRADVHEIMVKLMSGRSQRSVAEEYGLTQGHVSGIKTGKRWRVR